MKQFNLQEYLANPNRQVVTRDGQKVRIVCTDRAGLNTKPIVALIILPNGDEVIKTFWDNGIETAGSEDKNDLFLGPIKHTDWVNLYRTESGQYKCGAAHKTEQIAKNVSVGESQYVYVTTIKVEWEEE